MLSASVNPVPIGGITIIAGRGFTPGRIVVVQWRRPDGTMAAVRVLTSSAGAFAFRLLADQNPGGNTTLHNASVFNGGGTASANYAGNPGTASATNANSTHAVSQYDIACFQAST